MGLTADPGAVRRLGAALGLALLVAGPFPAWGQSAEWSTRSTRVSIDLSEGGGDALVTINYVLGATDGGVLPLDRAIDVQLLGFDDATVERFTTADGRSVELWPTRGSHRAAALHPPFAAGDSLLRLDVRYTVPAAVAHDGGSVRGRVPLLVGPASPATDAAGAFEATMVLPPEWTVSEGFPSGLERTEQGAWRVTLQTTPAMVGFRGRTDGVWRPGVPLAVDAVTLLLLLGFSLRGWRHLSGVAREARA